jgi:hypothetical protein
LVAGVLVAGCGGDDNKSDSSSASTPATDTSTADTGGSSGGGSANPQVKQAVEACKQQIAAQPGIDASVKADLTKICEKAASGDEQAVRDATKQVCTKLVEANVPSGSARDQALAACNQAGGTP